MSEEFEFDIDSILPDNTKNFKNLENKLKAIISKCSNETRINTFTRDEEPVSTVIYGKGIKNCNRIDEYKVDTLYVYVLSNNNSPIDYFISEKPLGINAGMEIGGSFVEYSKGGTDNGISYMASNGMSYGMEKYIGFCDDKMDSSIRVTDKGSLYYSETAYYSPLFGYKMGYKNDKQDKAFASGDIVGFIENSSADYYKQSDIKESFLSLSSSINSIAAKIQADEQDAKKTAEEKAEKDRNSLIAKFKGLIVKNRELDIQLSSQLDPFSSEGRSK